MYYYQYAAADFVGNVLPSATVSFAPGEASKTITVNVQGDTAVEADEGFQVTLSNATSATLTTATASGTIRNDDAPTHATLPDRFEDNDSPQTAHDLGTVAGIYEFEDLRVCPERSLWIA